LKLMKRIITLCFVIGFACSAHTAEIKIATIDMQRLVKEYYRAEEVARQFEERHKALFKELAQLRLDGDRLVKETQDLQERSLDSALSEAGRAKIKRDFESKLAELRTFGLRYDETKTEKEAEFQNQAVAANKRILEDILTTTRGIGEKEGFNLVLNASKLSPATSDVVFAKNVDDITEKVLASLNAAKPLPGKSSEPSEVKERH
jgi:Skp family chaperone for outer membrane proteins